MVVVVDDDDADDIVEEDVVVVEEEDDCKDVNDGVEDRETADEFESVSDSDVDSGPGMARAGLL